MAQYQLRDAPDELWAQFKAKAHREHHTMQGVLLAFVKLYVQDKVTATTLAELAGPAEDQP